MNNPIRFSDPTGHYFDEGCGSGNLCELLPNKPDKIIKHPDEGGNEIIDDGIENEKTGPITDFFLWLPGTANAYNIGATVFDSLAWLTDLYASGVVTYAGIYGAGLTGPFVAVGLPEVPVATGLAGMGIAELLVQPVLNIGNGLATISTLSTVVAETKIGTTRIEDGKFSNTVINSATLTGIGWVNKEAYISLAIQSVAVANDFGWTNFSIGNTHWDSLPFPTTSQ